MLCSLPRGAHQTSTAQITQKLKSITKRLISKKFQVPNEDISSDCDALSVVVTLTEEMTEHRRELLRNFILGFGEHALRCGLPGSVPGSKTEDDMFGCMGNQPYHLPELLKGNEMIVIDGPVKVGLHSTCKDTLANNFFQKGIYLTPASDKVGVCFQSTAASNKPCYEEVVDAVIKSCLVGKTHIIHLADMGFRSPLGEAKDKRPMAHIFDKVAVMAESDIKVELTQIDIAFTIKAPPDHLVQSWCEKKSHERNSLLNGTKVTLFPIHHLPDLTSGALREKDLRGTIKMKRENLDCKGYDIILATKDDDELDPVLSGSPDRSEATNLFVAKNAEDRAAKSMIVHSSSVHNLKGYSTFAHYLLQQRNKYPMAVKAMYGIAHRSFESLQTLINNLESTCDTGFNIVKKHGVGYRIEVSIRPHHSDPLRWKGHFNDMLLLVCVAVQDFCLSSCKPVITFIGTREVTTKVMRLVREANSMLKFRRSTPFHSVYSSEAMAVWLRSHLSLLMITIGISPAYSIKYINSWLTSTELFDPHSVLPRQDETSLDPKDPVVMHLDKILRELAFSRLARVCLTTYVRNFPKTDHISSFKSLSLSMKQLLASMLWSNIIPHVSQSQSGETNATSQPKGGNFDVDNARDSDNCWAELGTSSNKILNTQVNNASLPEDPVALILLALSKMSTLWSPERPGYMSMLCHLVLKRRRIWPSKMMKNKAEVHELLTRCASGLGPLQRHELHFICKELSLTGGKNNHTLYYQELLCHKYKFPYSSGAQAWRDNISVNKILNEVLSEDIVVVLSQSDSLKTVYRVADDTTECIAQGGGVLVPMPAQTTYKCITKCSDRDLYKVLAKSLNTDWQTLRKMLHNKFNDRIDFPNTFLAETGHTYHLFWDVKKLVDLEDKHQFSVLYLENFRELIRSLTFIPGVIIAMVSFLWERNITFYDRIENKMLFFTRSGGRLLTHHRESHGFTSKTASITVIRETNQVYQWSELESRQMIVSPPDTDMVHTVARQHRTGPLGGRTTTGRNLQVLRGLQTTRKQSFYTALSKLLQEIDNSYIENSEFNSDHFGLLAFLEEFTAVTSGFDGFDANALGQCKKPLAPLDGLFAELKDLSPSQWRHEIVCLLTCLKYNNLALGVFTVNDCKHRTTLFSAFNPFTGKVEQEQLDGGYTMLTDRPNTLYLYKAKDTSNHYSPTESQKAVEYHRLNFSHSIIGKFSHLGTTSFQRLALMLKEQNNMRLVFDIHEMERDMFRPEHPTTVVIPTHVTSKEGTTMCEVMQLGVKHHALMLIFPCHWRDTNKQQWDICIVHHPLQYRECAMSVLNTFIGKAPDQGMYSSHCLVGKKSEGSESGYYYLLYAYLGSKCSSLIRFRRLIKRASLEDQLIRKIRHWIEASVCQGGTNTPPTWLEQLTMSPG